MLSEEVFFRCYNSRKKNYDAKNLCMLNNELPGISKNLVCLIFYPFGFKLRKFNVSKVLLE